MDEPDPPIISFSERSKHVGVDSTVRCSRCNKLILMHSTQCEHCGIHFSGEAWEFSPSTEIEAAPPGRISKWVIAVVVFILIATLLL